MKNSQRKPISILLVVVMLITLLPSSIFAAEGDPFRVESSGECYATLEEAIAAAEATDTVTVLADAQLTATVTIPAGSDITLTGEKGISLLRGKGFTESMISVADGASLTVNNLTLDGNCGDFYADVANKSFTGGAYATVPLVTGENFSSTTVNGAIIYSAGSLKLDGAVLQNGAGAYGGAVYVEKGSLVATNTAFRHNLAAQGGGALYAKYCAVRSTGCIFTDNFAYNPNNTFTCRGGAVYLWCVGYSFFSDCTFSNNTISFSNGGAVSAFYNGTSTVELSFIDCGFMNNACGNDGFAIEVDGSINGTYTRCNFIGNVGLADGAPTDAGYRGQSVGVTSFTRGKSTDVHTFTDCTYQENEGLCIGDHGWYKNFYFIRTDFIGNCVGKDPEIVLFRSSNTYFEDCEFVDNKGYFDFVYSDARNIGKYAECDFVSCRFENNSYTNNALFKIKQGTEENAGCEYGFNITAKDCVFTNNSYVNGIVRILNYANVTMENCEFTENTSSGAGYIVCAANSNEDMPDVSVLMKNCRVQKNYGPPSGASPAVYVVGSTAIPTVEITDCEFMENTSGAVAGAFYAKNATVTVNNTLIHDNTALLSSAGGFYAANGATVNLGAGTKIYNNTAAKSGGGFVADNATVNCDPTVEIYNNHAGTRGDDIFFNAGTFNLPAVVSGRVLDDCGHAIDGWYDDSQNTRWNADDMTQTIHAETIAPGTYTTTLSVKAAHPALPTASMTYSTTFSYTEPWSLLFGAALKLDGELIDTAEYTNYGAYILKTDEPIDADTLTTQYMIDNGKNYSKEVGQWEENYVFNGTKRIRLMYDEQLYTYQLGKHIYVMFYIEYDGQTYYGAIKDRQEKAILESISQNGTAGNTAFSEAEVNLVSKILELYYATQEYLNSVS